ncbi:hypothetical protein K3495_g3366 [Podosphaera aphanis]|nr:hypothetical protein K3495_g3366 [Podosphaera aphanis]
MLKGHAFDYYFANIGIMPQTFDSICKMFEEYFEGEEYKRGVLDKWNNIDLKSTINQHWKTEKFFHNKIITACQRVKACSIACTKPANTVASLLEELRSGITTYELSNPTSIISSTFNAEDKHEIFYTDRKFRRHYDNNNSRPNERQFNFSNRSFSKKCFVYHRGGCWSSRHTQEEGDESYRKFKQKFGNQLDKSLKKRFEQFVAEYKGDEPDDVPENNLDNDEDFDILIAGLELHYPSSDETFLTSAVPIDGNSIISNLADHSFLHRITEKLETNQPSTIRYGSQEFYGIMIDTGGAERSTAGYNQYLAFNQMTGTEIDNSTANKAKISFGMGSADSIGSLHVNSLIGLIEFHVLHADTPFLLSIADMDRLNIYYNKISNTIVTPSFSYPVIRRFGHPFLLWKFDYQSFVQGSILTNECFSTNSELCRLHRRFGHLSVDRLRRLLERSGHNDFNISYLNNLTNFCKQCQLKGKSPGRFKFNLRDELNFNYSIIIDIMYIDGKPVLHVVHEATRFQAARWLDKLSSKHTWDTLRQCWIDTYVGSPDWIINDAGANFVGKEFIQHASSLAMRTKSVPVEAHWSIGIVERYHHMLRRAYKIVVEELKGSGINKEMALQMAVKAMNDSAGPDGLVPTLLVFGTYPRMSEIDPPAPSISQRAKAIQKAMEEIGKLRAQKQIADALNQRNGPNSGRGGNWKGPYKFLGIDGETCKILLPSGITDFRSTPVKPFFQEPIDAETNNAPEKNVITAPAISEHGNNRFSAVPNVEPEPQQQPRRSERQRAPRKLPYDNHLPADISVQLQLNDPR